MANLTRLDGYWAAKIISAFTKENLRIIIRQGDYLDPRSEAYLLTTLLARQEKIVRYWFDRVPPLDFFRPVDGGVDFQDLAVERGFLPVEGTRYRYRLAAVDAQRRPAGWTEWQETTESFIPLPGRPEGQWRRIFAELTSNEVGNPFLAMECQLNRGKGWSSSTTVYRADGSGPIVALDR